MCDTSKSDACSRHQMVDSMMLSLYWMGIDHPANGTILPACTRTRPCFSSSVPCSPALESWIYTTVRKNVVPDSQSHLLATDVGWRVAQAWHVRRSTRMPLEQHQTRNCLVHGVDSIVDHVCRCRNGPSSVRTYPPDQGVWASPPCSTWKS